MNIKKIATLIFLMAPPTLANADCFNFKMQDKETKESWGIKIETPKEFPKSSTGNINFSAKGANAETYSLILKCDLISDDGLYDCYSEGDSRGHFSLDFSQGRPVLKIGNFGVSDPDAAIEINGTKEAIGTACGGAAASNGTTQMIEKQVGNRKGKKEKLKLIQNFGPGSTPKAIKKKQQSEKEASGATVQ